MADFERFPISFYFLFAFAADGIGIAISSWRRPKGGGAYWNAAGQI
jgi:hypothetical protein